MTTVRSDGPTSARSRTGPSLKRPSRSQPRAGSGPAAATTDLRRERVADQIIDTLRDLVLDGTYPRGSRLPTERELATEYRVSAPTVREALRALTSMGLLEVRHGSGAYVRTNWSDLIEGPLAMLVQLEGVSIEELIGLVHVLNLHAAALAIDAASDEDVENVRAAAQLTAQCQTLDDVHDRIPAFLVSLSAASHQPLLEALSRFLTNILVGLELSSYKQRSPTFWRRWAAETAPMRLGVAEALLDRDGARLRAAVTQLHDSVVERIRAVPSLRSASLADPAVGSFIRDLTFRPPLR